MGRAFQGSSEVVVQAGPERVYTILEDSTLLSQWAPMIKHTTGKIERVGSVRECRVEWDGRKRRGHGALRRSCPEQEDRLGHGEGDDD